MAKSIVDKTVEWFVVAVIVIVGLQVITSMIIDFCKTNQLFCNIVLGSVLSAIIVAAVALIKRSGR